MKVTTSRVNGIRALFLCFALLSTTANAATWSQKIKYWARSFTQSQKPLVKVSFAPSAPKTGEN